ncbi:uncharacterized protein LOC126749157 [Anthonomus grandis grandis]|uniref:uncharacterized protein LOC126749157 n=1 Tax=Anthonomus grandis grandis TaxID=2921223 RepID=UPI002165DEEA|nr:uncharacterized protein LOC126749157 [Anthonomus grandis grandis]
MAVIRAILFCTITIFLYGSSVCQSDLRSALAAVDRRQKEMAKLEQQEQYGLNLYDQPEEIAFLNNPADGRIYDKDYMDDDESLNKRLRSAFRERMDEDRENKLEEFARNLYNNVESNRLPSGLDTGYLRELYNRYYGNDVNYPVENLAKRYYPIYGMQNVGLRKRGRFVENNEESSYAIHHHIPRQDDDSDYHMGGYAQDCESGHENPYGNTKRFLVAKRSSASKINKDQKRSVKKQTDPKVEKDLSNIFGAEKNTEIEHNKLEDVAATTPKTEAKTNEGTLPPRKIEKKDKPKMDPKDDLNKEIFEPVAPMNDRSLTLRKKSIDWSDYFGLDRRKKSDPSKQLDKEWLMERYHKAVALAPKKRNMELPFDSFHNHESTPMKKDSLPDLAEAKIAEMDKKLGKLEDEIVEDALKYTGAHHEEADSKEVQQVKDNIISRLAQAYNIEKMRNALEEYKMEVEKARKEIDLQSKVNRGIFAENISEEKRVAVPRKEAIDDTRDTLDGDNNIKCTQGDDCHEQTYPTPTDILENHFGNLECPAIQRACNDVASLVGHYGHVFEAACNMHQMCLICSNNSWFSPTRQCNMLFLTKAFELCLGKEECKKEARRSLKYLMDINKSLQAQATLTEECEVQCPEIDVFSK